MAKIILARHIYESLTTCLSTRCNSYKFVSTYMSLWPSQCWFLTLSSNDLVNHRPTLTHSCFDTNISIFHIERPVQGLKRLLIHNPPIANFLTHPIDPSGTPSLDNQCFGRLSFPSILYYVNYCSRDKF